MNISQILSEGSGLVLSNVTVKADYGLKAGKSPHRAMLVSDGSGQTIVKIWGAASSIQPALNETISIQGVGSEGGLSASEWNGKWSINANNCEIIRGGAPGAAQASQPAPPVQHAQPATPAQQAPPSGFQHSSQPRALSPQELAEHQVAHLERVLQLMNQSPVVDSVAPDPGAMLIAAAHLVGAASDWWFGEKYPGCKG